MRRVLVDLEDAHLLELGGQVARHVERALLDLLEALEAVAHQHVVLAHDLRRGAREVDGHRGLLAAQVAHPEDQVLGQRLLAAPHHPADAGVHEAVLVAGAVDGPHVLQLEVPHQVGLHERGEHAARRAVHVNADGQLRMILVVRLHQLVELLHVVELAGVRDAQDGRDADGVVVHVVHDRVHVQRQVVLLKRHEAHLDVPVAAEFFPAHLVARGNHQVGALRRVDVDARVLRQLLPAEQHAQAAQHARLGRADGGRAHGLLGRVGMPQVADHGDAAVLEVGRHGVLVLVDGILLHRLGHDLRGHGLHVRLAERGEVLRGVALD